eukprot:11781741-Ditylum_brightwellii.AAC.1
MVEINAFNQFHSLNVESSDKEGELKEEANTADSDSSSSKSKASCLLSDASNSEDDIENDS